MSKYRFSVFTATYNRAKMLPKVYESLVNQKFTDFEWIVIDDGSEDNTEELLQSFIAENKLNHIYYVKKENGGKHTAWREATKLFQGEYVLTLDSDDFLLPNTLYIFDKRWRELEQSPEYDNFWEVKARLINEKGLLIGEPLPKPIVDAHAHDFIFKYNFFADLDGCRKVDVLKKEAKVPESFLYEDYCNNFAECIRWFRAGRMYKTRYVQDITGCVVTTGNDRLSSSGDTLKTSSKLTYNRLVGGIYMLSENKIDMLRWNKVRYLKSIASLCYYCFILNINVFKIPHKELYKFPNNLFIFLGYLPMYMYYLIKR